MKRAGAGRGRSRKLGSPNAPPKSAKDAFADVFNDMGGTTQLREWAIEHQTEFYKLYARLIPAEVVGDPERPLGVVILPPLRAE